MRAPVRRLPKPPVAGPTRVRKSMYIDQRKLDAVKRHLGVATETEAVDQALDMVVFQAEVLAGLDALAACGPIQEVYRRGQVKRVGPRGR